MIFRNLTAAFNNLITQAGSFLLSLVVAIVVFLIGIIIAVILEGVAKFVLDRIGVDEVFERLGLNKFFKDLGFNKGIVGFGGWVVKWFIIVVVLVGVTESLGLPQISSFINQIALFIPNIIAAVIILIVGVLIADALATLAYNTANSAKLTTAPWIRTIVKWTILIFTFFAVLTQLQIAANLIQILFTGIVAALTIASGLAFGLGGKDKAKEVVDKFLGEAMRNWK